MESSYRLTSAGDNENGNVYYAEDLDVSVFEDVQGDRPAYYAWRGTFEAHDRAYQSRAYQSPDAAIEDVLGQAGGEG